MWSVFRTTVPWMYPDCYPAKGHYHCTFLSAHRCDLNMPRCLFSALHRCHVGALSLQKHQRILLRLASPGLASPSLKLTTPAPSARHHRGLWGWYTCVCALWTCVCISKCALVFVPLRFNQFFFFCLHTLYMYLCGWVNSNTGSMNRINETHIGNVSYFT